jgi:UDP-N-acetylglucosamine:LPS N-acetylglucosamine transferase
MHISQKPLKLSAILRDCDLVISHAGNGTVAATLLAGIPQLLLPTQLEQMLLSRRVVELGAGMIAEARPAAGTKEEKGKEKGKDSNPVETPAKARKPPDYAKLLDNLLKKTKYRQAARAFAKKYARFSQARQINLMANRVEEILAGKSTH